MSPAPRLYKGRELDYPMTPCTNKTMIPRSLIAAVVLLALPPSAQAQPLAPVAPASAVVILKQSPVIQDEPRIVLARADDPATAPKVQPGSPAPAPEKDPFASLKVVTPRDKLTPLRSVRGRKGKAKDGGEKKNISVTIGSSPSGAGVSYGGKSLGTTPLSISAPEGSTPMDIVVRARGRMTLRTRVSRDKNRSYYYRLHPAKFR
jgi:hypothetical protein